MERDIRIILAENVDRFWDRKEVAYSKVSAILGSKEKVTSMLEGRGRVDITTVQKLAELFGVNTISMFEDWSEDECN